jgi:hypothetical protein
MIQDAENGESLAIASENGAGKRLSSAEFQGLGEMPPELEWFANLDNPPHPARLPARRPGLHRLCRHRAARGDAPGHPRPPDRLAQRPRAPRPGPQFHPAQAGRGRFII